MCLMSFIYKQKKLIYLIQNHLKSKRQWHRLHMCINVPHLHLAIEAYKNFLRSTYNVCFYLPNFLAPGKKTVVLRPKSKKTF